MLPFGLHARSDARTTRETDRAFSRELKEWRTQLRADDRNGGFADALREGDRLARRYPDRSEVHRELAARAEAAGEHERAVVALRDLTRLGHDGPKTRLRLARALSALGRRDEAVAALRPAAEAELVDASFLAKYGFFCRDAALPEESVEAFRRSLALNPVHRPAWEGLIGALEQLGRHDEATAARAELERVPAKLTAAEVVRRVRALYPDRDDEFVVNVGCHDGISGEDPCFELFQEGFPGIALDAGDFQELFENLPQENVRKLLRTFVTPSSLVDVLVANGCPARPSLLKIDIDSFDGVLLEAALARLEPLVIQIEVNGEIPPPIRFAVHYDPRIRHSARSGFYGCSVGFVTALGRAHGYELLEVDLRNPPHGQGVILVRREHLGVFGIPEPVDERALFLAEPIVIGGFRRSGFDTAGWREQTDYDTLLSEVWAAAVAGSIEQNGEALPFLLDRGARRSASTSQGAAGL